MEKMALSMSGLDTELVTLETDIKASKTLLNSSYIFVFYTFLVP